MDQLVNHFVAAIAISRERVMWSPPPNGVIKINWDAAINKTKGCIGGLHVAFFGGLEASLKYCKWMERL